MSSSEGTGGGLIDAPHDLLAGSRLPRALAWAVVLLFLGLCAGTGLVDSLAPVPAPRLLGGEARQDAQRREQARVADGSAARLLEHDLRLTSRVRRTVVEPWGMFLYHALREAGNDVIVGPEDWLFLRNRTLAPPLPARDLVLDAAVITAAARRRLAGYGVELVAVPVPRKAVASRDHLPEGIDPRPEIEQAFVDELRRRGVRTVDLLPAFLGSELPTFFPGDSHWNEEAERLAAETVVGELGLLVPEERRSSVLAAAPPEPTERKTFYFFGVDTDSPWLAYLDQVLCPAWQLRDREGRPFEYPQPGLLCPMAVAGTSFSARREFPQFLAHFSDAPVLNFAQPGAMPLEQLAGLVQRLGEVDPATLGLRHVVLEYPMHLVLTVEAMGTARALFSGAPPRWVLPVAGVQGKDPRGSVVQVRGRTQLTAWAPGRLVHDGNGSMAVEIRGRREEGLFSVEVQVGDEVLRAVWPPRADRVVLPLLSRRPGSEGVRVFLRGEGRLALEEVGIVAEADPSSALPLEERAARPGADADWRQSLSVGGPVPIPHEGLLRVELRTEGRSQVGLHLETVSGRTLRLAPVTVDGSAMLTLDLAHLAGEELTDLVLFGSGEASGRPGRDPVLLGLPERAD